MLEVQRDQPKRDQPEWTGQKGPDTWDQDPKGTWAKRDQGHCQDQRNISVPSGFFF